MAYSESTPTGSEGGQFRWFVSMVRSYSGTAAENYEIWNLEGGVNRIATGITGYSRPDAYYELQAGTFAPGEGVSNYVAINFTNSVGRKFTASLPGLTIERFQDGTGLSASAYFYMFAGFVGVGEATANVNWNTDTKPRSAVVTATSGNIYETDNPSITFTNPAGFPIDVFLELVDLTSTTQYALRTNVTSSYTWTLTTPERDAIRAAMANTNSTSLGYFAKTNDGSPFGIFNGTFSTITIDNRGGIANPTFTNWSVTDTTGAIAATSDGNPVMVQGKSVARATVTTGNKAVAIKQATMSSYTFSVGPSSQSVAYSSGSTVTKDIDLATDAPAISGSQVMSLSAVDSRTNSTAVSKNVLVLPYSAPAFSPTVKVSYTNRFDTSGGLSVTLPGGTNLFSFSPLNYSGTDYNVINTTSGVQYQLHKDTINSGNPWNNITTSTITGTGVQTVNATTLATDILSTMNGMGDDNEVTWYVIFKVVDKYSTVTYQATIDVGAPIFRIGVDGNVYNNEKRILTVGDYTPDGWLRLVTLPDVITALGQHSYTVRLPSVDYTDRLSAGMRLRFTRTVAAPTQCTSTNGTTQYWSKSSPNKMTFVDNFTQMAYVQMSAYPTSGNAYIGGRSDTTAANFWGLAISPTGQIAVAIGNAGASNLRIISSYQSVPLNKKFHVAASWAAGTVVIYLDGVVIPSYVSLTSGTAPTVTVQSGDFSVGRLGGLTSGSFLGGKIAQYAVFDAVLSQATILSYMGQSLSGSEANCKSAYSFNGVATDLNTTTPNDLTANASVGYVNDSPFSATTEYGIITKTDFSANTTLTVQVPEGGAVPTTGGISALSFSNVKAPYGFPISKAKWRVETHVVTQETIGIGSLNTFSGSVNKLLVPLGEWTVGWRGTVSQESTVNGTRSGFVSLASSTPSITFGVVAGATDLMARLYEGGLSSTVCERAAFFETPVSLTAVTDYRLYGAIDVATGSEVWKIRSDQGPVTIFADSAYL